MSGRACRRRDEREEVVWVRRRFVELHEDEALDKLDLWMPGAVIVIGDKSLGGLNMPVERGMSVER